MPYSSQLSFLQQLLRGLHVSSCLIDDPDANIPSSVDLELRAALYGVEDYTRFFSNAHALAQPRTLYRFFDEYDCHYIFLRLPAPREKSLFYIGPYLLELPSGDYLAQRSEALQLTAPQRQQLQVFYTALPIIEDENLLLTMANTLCAVLWGGPERYSLEYIEYMIPDHRAPLSVPPKITPVQDDALALKTLEQNYTNERILMEAVSKGNLHRLTAMTASVVSNGKQMRLSDSLRDRKNDLIILKTLLRKAAEIGGVHPLHLHRITAHYAIEIENIRTIRESMRLQDEMIRSFCQLVRQHALSRYSYYVAQAITLVQYDLTADLRLHAVAAHLGINASYLSDLFHREYGCTLTEFVCKERIDHGMMLLASTSKSVQDIAALCGVHDTAYFIKLFKKHTGLTPAAYRKQAGDRA